MKKENTRIVLLIIGLLMIFGMLESCSENGYTKNGKWYESYTDYTITRMNELKPPVILIGKEAAFSSYNITVRDSNKVIETFHAYSTMASSIGNSNEVGDTIN